MHVALEKGEPVPTKVRMGFVTHGDECNNKKAAVVTSKGALLSIIEDRRVSTHDTAFIVNNN
jgi:hypothetical protein